MADTERNSALASLPALLLALYAVTWTWTALSPVSRLDWMLENILVVLSLPVLITCHRRTPFSNGACLCLFIFYSLHAIGAHYTYALVPYESWLRALTGSAFEPNAVLHRNHFDRFVHLAYGVLTLPPVIELIERHSKLRGAWRYLLPVSFVMAHSVFYETAEWLTALVVSPELGIAYLGAQGDPWDAQKDSALAALGAAISMGVVALRRGSDRPSGPTL